MQDRETRVLWITDFRQELAAFPKMGDIPPRVFKALKIYIQEENGRALRRHYWIDSKRLIAKLLPKLRKRGGRSRRYKIKKFGFPPKSKYTVQVDT